MSHLSSKGNKHFLDATSSMWPLASFFSVSFWPRHQSFSGNTPFRFSAMPKHVFLLCRPGRLKKKRKKLARAFTNVFHTQRCLQPLEMTVFLLNDNYTTCGLGRQRHRTLGPISTFCVLCFFACVSGWRGKTKKRIRIRAAVSNVTVAFERKQNTGISIWSCDPIGS